jgi:hypothetical protein
MIVDCHTHIKCRSGEVGTAEHLEACAKVDACIVLSSGKDDLASANKEVSQYVGQSQKMTGFAVVNPLVDKVGVKKVSSITRDLGLKGLVLYCAEHGFHPSHSRAIQLYESAEELSLPVFFHNAGPYGSDAVLDHAQPYLLDEIARRFPSLKIVIGRMGIPFVSQTLCLLAKHEHIYADLSIDPGKVWEVYNIVIGAHEAGVMDKLLFGSGYPYALPDNCIETLLGFNKLVAEANLPTVRRENIRTVIERDTLSLLGIS